MKLRCPPQSIYKLMYYHPKGLILNVVFKYISCSMCLIFGFFFAGRPEPTVTWFNGTEPIQTNGGVAMGRHVIVNRLEIPHLTREAYNSTLRCQASNTKLAPPVERTVRLDMLCKYLFIQIAFYDLSNYSLANSVSHSSIQVDLQSHHFLMFFFVENQQFD